ncbi:immunoglobulin superfamily member 2 [Emydura macquarii macquarii]|uniref:immunoglobulin superfamily member 2 n=1 Tax=Emydura macquarii macquarii TaxID=1129001 RepID=UPI003529E546
MGSIQSSVASLLFILGLCVGQRVVLVQEGRLYRARGYHITIWCNVSGFQGPSEQNFQWSIYLPSAPEREVQIISTMDPSFPYASYTQRVRSGEIYIERVQGDAALLHIKELQDRDAGEYECHTPTTDERYFGSYSAKMNLSVIPDTVLATMTPQVLTRVEGDPLELTCEVSKSTAQHTHLSVAWYHLQGAGEGQAMMILSLSKDFVLTPGSSYTQRFLSDVRLDKVGNTTYKLSIDRVQASDQGQVYCEAVEWIQDPDGTWKDIARKQTENTSLIVGSRDRDFHANIAAVESSLAEGKPLQVDCSVKAQNSQNRWFQVVWLFKEVEIARIDPHGVLALKKEYEERAALGQFQMMKKSNEMYIFKVYQVGLKDKGTYSCTVSEMEKASTGFSTIQSKTSSGIDVNVKPIESHMRVSVLSERQIMEGDTLILHCEVSEATNPLSVNWWHLRKSGDQPEHIVEMERDGVLRPGTSYQERSANRDLRLEKVNSTTFTLAIYNTSATNDGGSYKCEVTEWSMDRSWKQAQETSVAISPLGSNVSATLISRTADIKFTQDFELFCQVPASYVITKVPVSITWQFQPSTGPTGYQQLVKIMPSGTIEWGAAPSHFQRKTRVTKSASASQLLIHSATEQDAGRYRCEVEFWRRSSQHAGHPAVAAAAAVMSNVVAIKVTPPESKLRVDTEDRSLEISGSTDTEIKCRITSLTQKDAQLAVTWYFLPPSPADAAPLQIVSTNYSNILEYGAEFSSPMQKSKFHSERVSSDLFQLRILSVNHGDRGRYYCLVEEWLWTADSGWYKLGKKESGKTMLEFKLSENKLHVEKTNHSITATENEDVTMSCLLQGPSQPASLFSAIWFHGLEHSGMKTLMKMHASGMVEYAEAGKGGRLHLRRPSFGDFSLTLRSVELGDAGVYWCQVQEWQQDGSGAWVERASELSGYTRLTALPPESTVSSRVCSSPSLLHFILIYPLILFLSLIAVFLCLYAKIRQTRKESIYQRKGKELWLDLKGVGDVEPMDADHNNLKAEETD